MAHGEETAHSYTMVGGDAPNSYSKNSTYQKALLDAVKEKINEAISKTLDITSPYFDPSSCTFQIADYGCSVGPNTFVAVQNIIEAVELKYKKEVLKNPENAKDIEFLVFFNDHSNNDFNTLFRTLPQTKQYSAAGVPGSFFHRVLPKGRLHIGHCSYSLQWLSKVPKGIADRDSPAWNKDIHCTGFVKEVAEAYLDQWKIDMASFLSARAQELVPGGLLLLLGSCLPDGILISETSMGMMLDCMGSCLNDMAESGLASRNKLDSFTIPFYFAHLSEFKQVIEETGCFAIETMERVSHANEEFPLDSKFLTNSVLGALGGVVEENFGKQVIDEMPERLEKKIETRLPEFARAKNSMQFFILLQRN